MALFRREKRSSAIQQWFLKFQDAFESVFTHAGVPVTYESATTLPAVYRCISLNSDIISTLPIDVIATNKGKRTKLAEPFWMESPNDDQDWGTFLGQVQASLELDGNAFILKASTDGGRLAGLFVLDPHCVKVDKLDTGQKVYIVKQAPKEQEVIPASGMLHIMGYSMPGCIRGMSPVQVLKQSIGVGLAAEQYAAQFYGTGATLSGILSIPGPAPNEEMIERIQERFMRKHGGISKSHAVAIMSAGATFTPISVEPEKAQALQARRFTDVQIACAYGVPAEFVTEAEGAKGYVSGLYARQYMWMQTGINPRLVRLERAFSSLLPPGQGIKFNRNAFLAMDPAERATFYSQGLAGKWITPNEVREKEDMDPLPGGDLPLQSVQWQA